MTSKNKILSAIHIFLNARYKAWQWIKYDFTEIGITPEDKPFIIIEQDFRVDNLFYGHYYYYYYY